VPIHATTSAILDHYLKKNAILPGVGPKEVYWYLQAVPELLALAAVRSRQATLGGAASSQPKMGLPELVGSL